MTLDGILVTPTLECNIACGHCGQGRDIKQLTMDDEVLEKLLNEIASQKIPEVDISGGEVLSPKYRQRLLNALQTTKLGEKTEVNIHTSGWWAHNEAYARKIVGQLKNVHVASVSLSMGVYHQKFVPLENIANIIQLCEEASIGVHEIRVRSFKSTYHREVELIKKLAEISGRPIHKTMVWYQPTGSISRSTRFTTFNGFFDVYAHVGGFEGLKSVFQAVYSLGESSGYFPMGGGVSGINVTHAQATWAGIARETTNKGDIINPWLSGNPPIAYRPQIEKLTVMPDGSLLTDCGWAEMNDRWRARLGVYPRMSLAEAQRVSTSKLYGLGKFYLDVATFPLTFMPKKTA